eukprot:4040785-Amphidinium_carterae.2
MFEAELHERQYLALAAIQVTSWPSISEQTIKATNRRAAPCSKHFSALLGHGRRILHHPHPNQVKKQPVEGGHCLAISCSMRNVVLELATLVVQSSGGKLVTAAEQE